MQKSIKLIVIFALLSSFLTGCGLFSKTEQLKNIAITVDGNPQEWEPFPVVHNDPEGDNISIEFDISTVKAFANNQTKFMYVLVESFIPPQEFTSLELDLKYGEDLYRIAFVPDAETPAVMAHNIEKDQWDSVTDVFGSQIAVDTAIEIMFPLDQFPNTKNLKIADLRIMGGVCCNEIEWYAIDYIK